MGHPTDVQRVHVLFVGNSLTYYNNLPGMVEAIYRSSRPGVDIRTEFLASGGALIRDHLTIGRLDAILASKDFDVVVLQELGGFPDCPVEFPGCADSPKALEEAVKLVRAAGARPILFGTWQPARANQPSLSAATQEMGKLLLVEVADVGAAIHAGGDRASSKMLDRRGHPTLLGSWLAALVLTKAISPGEYIPVVPSLSCEPDWTKAGPAETELASAQIPPAIKCLSISKANFYKLWDLAQGS